MAQLCRYGGPLAVTAALGFMIHSSDRFIIGWLLNDAAVAPFGPCSRHCLATAMGYGRQRSRWRMAIMTGARGQVADPRLAVLIPVYNDQAGLVRSLEYLRSDGAAFDVVVVDDGSARPIRIPDGLPFRTELLCLERNAGIVAALNAGLEHITTVGHYQYVARLDAGDLSLPGRMTAQMAFLDAHPDHAVVGCWTRHVDPEGKCLFDFRPPAVHAKIIRFLRYRTALVHTSVMLRVRALKELGFYREPFAGAEDLELYLRLAHGYRLANLEQIFSVREITPNSITSRRQSILRSRLRVLMHHFDARSLHAYLGLCSNLSFVLLPRKFVLQARRLGDRLSRGRASPPEQEKSP